MRIGFYKSCIFVIPSEQKSFSLRGRDLNNVQLIALKKQEKNSARRPLCCNFFPPTVLGWKGLRLLSGLIKRITLAADGICIIAFAQSFAEPLSPFLQEEREQERVLEWSPKRFIYNVVGWLLGWMERELERGIMLVQIERPARANKNFCREFYLYVIMDWKSWDVVDSGRKMFAHRKQLLGSCKLTKVCSL